MAHQAFAHPPTRLRLALRGVRATQSADIIHVYLSASFVLSRKKWHSAFPTVATFSEHFRTCFRKGASACRAALEATAHCSEPNPLPSQSVEAYALTPTASSSERILSAIFPANQAGHFAGRPNVNKTSAQKRLPVQCIRTRTPRGANTLLYVTTL